MSTYPSGLIRSFLRVGALILEGLDEVSRVCVFCDGRGTARLLVNRSVGLGEQIPESGPMPRMRHPLPPPDHRAIGPREPRRSICKGSRTSLGDYPEAAVVDRADRVLGIRASGPSA